MAEHDEEIGDDEMYRQVMEANTRNPRVPGHDQVTALRARIARLEAALDRAAYVIEDALGHVPGHIDQRELLQEVERARAALESEG